MPTPQLRRPTRQHAATVAIVAVIAVGLWLLAVALNRTIDAAVARYADSIPNPVENAAQRIATATADELERRGLAAPPPADDAAAFTAWLDERNTDLSNLVLGAQTAADALYITTKVHGADSRQDAAREDGIGVCELASQWHVETGRPITGIVVTALDGQPIATRPGVTAHCIAGGAA